MTLATADQIAKAKAFGLKNVDLISKAADKAKLPFHVACALMQMESNGDNIWGGDKGGTFSRLPGQVTQELYRAFRWEVINNGKTSNGVGPCQLTWAGSLKGGKHTGGFFTDMESKGLKPWDTFDNMFYGMSLMAGYYKATGSWNKSGVKYNGGSSYGSTFSKRVDEWKKRLA